MNPYDLPNIDDFDGEDQEQSEGPQPIPRTHWRTSMVRGGVGDWREDAQPPRTFQDAPAPPEMEPREYPGADAELPELSPPARGEPGETLVEPREFEDPSDEHPLDPPELAQVQEQQAALQPHEPEFNAAQQFGPMEGDEAEDPVQTFRNSEGSSEAPERPLSPHRQYDDPFEAAPVEMTDYQVVEPPSVAPTQNENFFPSPARESQMERYSPTWL